MASDARLIWGSTALVSALTENDLRGSSPPAYIVQASADGTNFGNPQAVITEIRSHLQDGSLASVTSFDNREGTVTLMVSALTHDGLSKAEAALVAETKVPGYSTLSWTPSLALATPTVYDVVYSTLAWQFDDLNEIKRGNGVLRRFFTATFELLPFGRDVNMTAVQATSPPPATPTTQSIADGSTATGWSGPAAITTSGGAVSQTRTVSKRESALLDMSYTPASAVDTSTTKIIYFDHLPTGGVIVSGGAYIREVGASAPVEIPVLAAGAIGTAGYIRSYYAVPSSVASIDRVGLYFTMKGTTDTGTSNLKLSIDQLSRTNAIPGSGTYRQQSRSLAVGGSARARASLIVTADAGKNLGDTTIVYTRTAATGMQPPLRPYRISSAGVQVDATMISGAYNTLSNTPMVFNIPASKFKEAAHNLIARLATLTAGTFDITWTSALVSSTNTDIPETAPTAQTGTITVAFASINTWRTVEMGLLALPNVPVAADSTAMIRLTLLATDPAGGLYAPVIIDEAWLFDLDNGALSWVNTAGLTRLEVRPADLSNPEPSYWGGSVDGGGAAGLVRADWRTNPSAATGSGGSFAQHFMEPGIADIFTVTSGTEGSAVTLTYYRSFLHNVSS